MKLYQCKEEFCPYVGDPRYKGTHLEKFEDMVKYHCMFANGIPEGMCDHSENKQEKAFQKGIDEWM